MSAREQRHVGPQLARSGDREPRAIDLGQRDDEQRRSIHARARQQLAVRGVAEDARDAARAQLHDDVRITLDHGERDAERLQRLADLAAHAAEAAQHDGPR